MRKTKLDNNIIPQVAVYCRVSSLEQQEKGTINSQIDYAKKYCDLHNLSPVWYLDDGITGTLPLSDRPAGKELLQTDCKQILIYKIDRLGRNTRVVLDAIAELEQGGHTITSMTEPFDTSNPAGRFVLTMLAGVADLERSNILERMAIGTNRAAKDGKWMGGITPYGYYVGRDGYLAINEDEAQTVRLIYQLCIEGKTTVQIADYLNGLGILPLYAMRGIGKRKQHTNAKWATSRVLGILHGTHYYGLHQYGKRTTKTDREIISRPVPAIVSYDTWMKAQAMLDKHTLLKGRRARQPVLLRGKIKCARCGLNYHRINCGQYHWYACMGRGTRYGREKLGYSCNNKSVRVIDLDNAVWQGIVDFVKHPSCVAVSQKENTTDADLLTSLQAKLSKNKEGKERILDLYRNGIIGIDDLQTQIKNADTERKNLQSEISRLTSAKNAQAERIDYATKLSAMIVGQELTFDQKKAVIDVALDCVLVDGANVTIRYLFGNSE